MADLEDVLDVLCTTVQQTVYPNGTAQPSIINVPVKIYPGWPVPDILTKDITAGGVHVSVFPTEMEVNTTRYMEDWLVVNIPPPTITLTAAGLTVTVGGTVTTPQNVALIVDNKAVAYALQVGDTTTTIATALVGLLSATGVVASNTGPVISLPNAKTITARVGMWGTSLREIAHQERVFNIIVWAPTPTLRRQIAPPIDMAIKKLSFINLPDGTQGRIRYRSSPFLDKFEKHGVYRRDLCYSVDWATTEVRIDPQITILEINLRAPDDLLLKQINL